MHFNMNRIHLVVSRINRFSMIFYFVFLGLRTWRAHVDSVTGLEYIDQST